MGLAGNAVGQLDKLVGGVAHGRHHGHHVRARLPHRADAPGDAEDLLGVGHGGAAVFLDYEGHGVYLVSFFNAEGY